MKTLATSVKHPSANNIENKFESVCCWKLKIFFSLEMYEMYAGIYDKTISINFYQNLFLKVKVAWKNSKRFWTFLGLTLWVCLKASKVYPVSHNRKPTIALAGRRSCWKQWIIITIHESTQLSRRYNWQKNDNHYSKIQF